MKLFLVSMGMDKLEWWGANNSLASWKALTAPSVILFLRKDVFLGKMSQRCEPEQWKLRRAKLAADQSETR